MKSSSKKPMFHQLQVACYRAVCWQVWRASLCHKEDGNIPCESVKSGHYSPTLRALWVQHWLFWAENRRPQGQELWASSFSHDSVWTSNRFTLFIEFFCTYKNRLRQLLLASLLCGRCGFGKQRYHSVAFKAWFRPCGQHSRWQQIDSERGGTYLPGSQACRHYGSFHCRLQPWPIDWCFSIKLKSARVQSR